MARRWLLLAAMALMISPLVGALPRMQAEDGAFLNRFSTISTLASTVPANGDVNPYGLAVAPRSIGNLVRGNVLISNFNSSANQQGTGTTIVQISPSGQQSLFAQINAAQLPGACPGGVGLTTALAVLRSGWVIVGSLPTADGTPATAQIGCLLVLNSWGQVVSTIAGPLINGPWDMTALDLGPLAMLFVTNVLNGTVAANGQTVNSGTVVRITLLTTPRAMPRVLQETVIGSGFPERTDPAALVIGPTGVGLSLDDAGDAARVSSGLDTNLAQPHMGLRTEATLYVADSLNNRIAAIPNAIFRGSSAGSGRTVAINGALNDPLGLAIAPNGDILTVNGNDGNAVETTAEGHQVAVKALDSSGDPPGAGALFGLGIGPDHNGLFFVDDATNTLNLLH